MAVIRQDLNQMPKFVVYVEHFIPPGEGEIEWFDNCFPHGYFHSYHEAAEAAEQYIKENPEHLIKVEILQLMDRFWEENYLGDDEQ